MSDIKTYNNISEIDINQWKDLSGKSKNSSFFQTKECYDFYASLSFLQPFICGVSEYNTLTGIVCGYIISNGKGIKKFFSKRAIIPGGILLDEKITESALEELLKCTIQSLKKQVSYIEIRNYNDYSEFKSIFQKSGFIYNPHLNYQIDFTDTETAFKNLSESKQRQIKTAERSGVLCKETKDKHDIQAFYQILENLYRNKIKLPLFPVEFFEKLVKLPHGKLMVVRHDDKVIGGIACIALNKDILYEWFICGDERVEKKLYPSVMATWGGIKYAKENGFRRFDFMGAGKPDRQYGVRDFKSKFGGKLVEYGRFVYICNSFLYNMGKFYIERISPKLPFKFLNLIN